MITFKELCIKTFNNLKESIHELALDYTFEVENNKYLGPYPLFRLIHYRFNRFKISVRNLMYWFKYIWYDRDWDYYFIYLILRTKLYKVYGYQKLHGAVDHTKDLTEIKRCIDILDILIEDDVLKEEFDKFYDKYGNIEFKFRKLKEDANYYSMFATYKKIKSNEELQEADAEFKELVKKEIAKKEELKQELFSRIANNIENWWD